MASHGGHAPTQAAYTSLLAACYKICNDSGRNSHAVRAKAGTFGWKYWQEMRIIGIEPDGELSTTFRKLDLVCLFRDVFIRHA